MNETTTFRRIAAASTIGSFSLAALMGILALLGAGGFGDQEGRVLLTTLVVGCTSICVLCYLATAGTPWVGVGVLGSVVVVLPTVTSLFLLWSDWDGDAEGLLKAFGIGVVGAVTLAQVCLLLALAGPRENLRPVLGATVCLAVAVAGLVSAMVVGEIDTDDVWRLLGVAAILDVLGTLVTIALARFGGREVPSPVRSRQSVITLAPDQALEIERLARINGVPADLLVDDAVRQYLSTHTAAPSGA
ncbi:MAG: hypothetical protein JWQ74_2571 [Marmoricola sp.]|nr:hypothetical protein [Marmoricola sp.]